MKLARDSWLLVIVPAGFLLAGGWWVIASGLVADRPTGAVRFELADHGATVGAAADSSRSVGVVPAGGAERVRAGSTTSDAVAAADPARPAEPSPWAVWSGRVVTRDGMPIEGATVTITATRNLRLGDGTALGEKETIPAKIGKNGELVFEMKPGFRYELVVTAAGYGLEKFEVVGQAGRDLVLDRAGSVDGRVFDQGTKTPLAGATVTFQNGNEHYTTTTDENGRYFFDGVGAHPAHITVTDNRFISRTQSVDLSPGSSRMLDLFLDPGSALHGEVLTDGSQIPVGGLQVSLIDRLTQETVGSGLTDQAGRFLFFSLLPSREYYVSVTGAGYRSDRPAQIVGRGDSMTLTVTPTWDLDFKVSDPSGMASGVSLVLRRQDGLPVSSGQGTLSSVTGADGIGGFAGLSRDLAYRVVVSSPGMATLELGPITSPDGAAQMIPVDMVAGRVLAGRIVDTDGQPVPFVTVRANRLDGMPAPPLFVQADATGGFMFDSLFPGVVLLVTFQTGYDTTRSVVVIPDDGQAPDVSLTIPRLPGALGTSPGQ